MENTNHQQPPNPYASTVASLPVKPKAAQPYPYVRVVLGFALLGGATGGLILGLVGALLGRGGDAATLLDILLLIVFAGAVLGLVPAFLCGLWLAVSRARRNETGLLSAALVGAALVGAAISALYLLVITQEIASMPFGFLGGVAAFLVGLLLLPAPIDAA